VKILLLGSSGYVGAQLCGLLKATGYSFLTVDIGGDPEFRLDVIHEIDALSELIGAYSPDVVINLVALASNSTCIQSPKGVYSINVLFPGQLYRICSKFSVGLLLHASSEWIYGLGSQNHASSPSPEGFYHLSHDLYSRSKLDSEILLQNYTCLPFAFTRVASLRLGIIYGGTLVKSQSVVDKSINSYINGSELVIVNQRAARCFISVESVCHAFLRSSEYYLDSPSLINYLNVQGPRCIPISYIDSYLRGRIDAIPTADGLGGDSNDDIKIISPEQTLILGCKPSALEDYLDLYRCRND